MKKNAVKPNNTIESKQIQKCLFHFASRATVNTENKPQHCYLQKRQEVLATSSHFFHYDHCYYVLAISAWIYYGHDAFLTIWEG